MRLYLTLNVRFSDTIDDLYLKFSQRKFMTTTSDFLFLLDVLKLRTPELGKTWLNANLDRDRIES